MIVKCADKTELELNHAQKTACAKHAGAGRFAFNWGLSRKLEACKAGEQTPTAIDLHGELNALKKTAFAWMDEVSKCAPPGSRAQSGSGLRRLLPAGEGEAGGEESPGRVPEVQSEEERAGQLRLRGAIDIFEDAIQLPRLGRLRLKEWGYLPVSGVHLLSVTVSEGAGRWFVAVPAEVEISDPPATGKPVVGIDLGMVRLGTVRDGTVLKNPRARKPARGKLKRLQRIVSPRQQGCANRGEAVARLEKAHLRVANLRKDTRQQATSLLANTRSAVVLEDLNVGGEAEAPPPGASHRRCGDVCVSPAVDRSG